MLVRDIMTSKVIAIDPGMPIGDVHALMEQRNIRHFPILEAASSVRYSGAKDQPSAGEKADSADPKDRTAKLVGIVSDRDIRSVGSALPQVTQGITLKDAVARIMVSPVLTAHPFDPIEESAKVLREHKIGALPVVDEGEMVGIVTAIDFLEALVKMTGVYEAAARLEIEADNRPGVLARLAAAISKRNVNISSVLTTYKDADSLNLVLRVGTIDIRGLAEALKADGFGVVWPPDQP